MAAIQAKASLAAWLLSSPALTPAPAQVDIQGHFSLFLSEVVGISDVSPGEVLPMFL